MERVLKLSLMLLLTVGGIDAAVGNMESEDVASEDVGTEPAAMFNDVSEAEVAFTVHNPGDPNPQTVRGTVYYKRGTRPGGRAVLMHHGATLDRRFWDGFEIPGAPRLARRLALKSGLVVVTIDRLGYGESPYLTGPGFALTPNTYVETTHEMIAQIRAGSFAVLSGSPPRGASGVVLAGQSVGSAEIELYATRYDDIDGLIPFGWSNFGPQPSMLAKIFREVVMPQIVTGAAYIFFFPPEPDGYSELCEMAVYYLPGVDDDVLAEACSNGYHNTLPAGELFGVNAMTAEIRANVGNVDVPVLLMFAREDNMVPGPGWGGFSGNDADVVTPEIEMWENGCNCDVTVHTIRRTSHDFPLHRSANRTADRMARWLDRLD